MALTKSHLVISDTEVTVGVERISVNNPPNYSDWTQLDDLIAMQTQLVSMVRMLEIRVSELERRTWWSMLKDLVKGWFAR